MSFHLIFVAILSNIRRYFVQHLSPFRLSAVIVHLSNFVFPTPSIHQRPWVVIHPCRRTIFFKPYVVLELCS